MTMGTVPERKPQTMHVQIATHPLRLNHTIAGQKGIPNMKDYYHHLGVYSDLATAIDRAQPVFPVAKPGLATQQLVRQCLSFEPRPAEPMDVRIDDRWERDGVTGEAVSWSAGYGPRTEAYLLRPQGATGPLPGVLALHDHGGFKFYGKEKIADGPGETSQLMRDYRANYYGDRAYPQALAREGYAVLVPDTFLWGSRKFPIETMIASVGESPSGSPDYFPGQENSPEIHGFNGVASAHENVVAKYLTVLGATLAGVIGYEDSVAVSYLASRADVLAGRIGCIGLSGGGLRSGLLQATDHRISAAVVVGLMTTYEGVLDHNLSGHTWMLYPSDWGRHGDWSDLVACRAPSPLLVQYDEDDDLFTLEGQRAADDRLRSHYESVGATGNYTGQFYPGPHKFDLEMQNAAFAWLGQQLKTA